MRMSLGQRIKARRILCWFSQEEFANRVGVSRRQVAYWESDADAPSALSLQQICRTLHVSSDWLLTGKGWLRDVHDPEKYKEQKALHVSKLKHLKEVANIPLYDTLPLDFKSRTLALKVLPEDLNAVALALNSDQFSPQYCKGDILLMRPVNIHFLMEMQQVRGAPSLALLHQKHAVVILNGSSSIKELEVETVGENSYRAKLRNIGERGRARAVAIKRADDLHIQAVIYKCVRAVS